MESGEWRDGGGCPYEVGDRVRFQPCACWNATAGFAGELGAEVTGVVIQINAAHRWYRVEYELPGCIGHETFKF